MVSTNAVINTYPKRIFTLSTTEVDPSPSPQPLTSISLINQYRKASEDALALFRCNVAGAEIDGVTVTKQLVDMAMLLQSALPPLPSAPQPQW